MNLGLTNDVALVVGGARGLGLAIAKAFADEGCRVGMWDVLPEVRTAAAEFGAVGWRVDVTDFGAVQSAARETWAHFGAVDHVVFAVGVGSGKFGFPFWNKEQTRKCWSASNSSVSRSGMVRRNGTSRHGFNG
ncbi:MAG: SDR family NAD(P)-dependent oxidoreductase [Gemmataceae bacterium]|nr:SDR family NAD(P)-dependent oxidoreductase [Gemmataceae bacterium]